MKFLVTIFISAFLLFQIQPILAKMALPFFGGGAAIWTACMLFFQLFLLFGYLYSHCLTKLSNLKHQILIHCCLVGTSLLFLPIVPFSTGISFGWQAPQLGIIFSLFIGIGFPYFLLSSTAPLIQKWYSWIPKNNEPYRLYSLSNLGSLLALLSYPFLIEPNMSTDLQANTWSIGYGVFAVLILLIGYQLYGRVFEKPNIIATSEQGESVTSSATVLLWLLFSAASVILMVSTTSAMTQNVPPTPFLWILPLCIYLLTYVICFNNDKWYVRKYCFILFSGCSIAAVLMFFIGTQFNIFLQVAIYSLILFFACMLCHGELARLKPNNNKLTSFYLVMAFGGVIGSIFTSLVAEQLFTQYYEFPVGIAIVYLLFACSLWQENINNELSRRMKKQNSYFAVASIAGLLVFSLYFLKLNNVYYKDDVYNSRNFYGTLSVKDFNEAERPTRMLFDGTTSHGTQSLSELSRDIPTSYYRFDTGVSLALQTFAFKQPKKVGVIGLGTGTLAAYGNVGDDYVFYELNPDVELAAKNYFSYLSMSKAKVSIRIGDARVTLQNELAESGSQAYQVLVVDAFSSDSIPVHLLTLEAFQLYWKHLKEDGLLVLHISNNHLDLLPLVATLSEKTGRKMQHFYSASDDSNEHTAEWVVVTNNKDFYTNKKIASRSTYFKLNDEQKVLWTDAYSNLLSVIK
jgi:spermidine synthase